MSGKGGMSKNAFGGHERLDKLDLVEWLRTAEALPFEGTQEALLYLSIIQNSVQHYLFFGLGRNGVTRDQFVEACRYLFTVRSDKPETWSILRVHRESEKTENGGRVATFKHLSDSQLKMMCLDKHYPLSGLDYLWTMEKFLAMLIRQRRELLQTNREQVLRYLQLTHARETRYLDDGAQLPLVLKDPIVILTQPQDMRELAELLLYPRNLKRSPRIIRPRQEPVLRRPKAQKGPHHEDVADSSAYRLLSGSA